MAAGISTRWLLVLVVLAALISPAVSQCEPGDYWDGTTCATCFDHHYCPGGTQTTAVATPCPAGYATPPVTTGKSLSDCHTCPYEGLCVGGSCRAGHTGNLCFDCEESDHILINGECTRCVNQGVSAFLHLLGFAVLVIWNEIVSKLVGDANKLFGFIVRVILLSAQRLGVSLTFRGWTMPSLDWLDWLTQMNFATSPPKCFVSISSHAWYFIFAHFPLFIVGYQCIVLTLRCAVAVARGICAVGWFTRIYASQPREQRLPSDQLSTKLRFIVNNTLNRLKGHVSTMVAVTGYQFYIFYMPYALFMWSPMGFGCSEYSITNESSYLLSNPAILCSDIWANGMNVMPAIFWSGSYIFPLPIVIFGVLLWLRIFKLYSTAGIVSTFGWLYRPYSRRFLAYFFEVPIFLHRVFIEILKVETEKILNADDPTTGSLAYAYGAIAMSFLMIFFVILVRPVNCARCSAYGRYYCAHFGTGEAVLIVGYLCESLVLLIRAISLWAGDAFSSNVGVSLGVWFVFMITSIAILFLSIWACIKERKFMRAPHLNFNNPDHVVNFAGAPPPLQKGASGTNVKATIKKVQAEEAAAKSPPPVVFVTGTDDATMVHTVQPKGIGVTSQHVVPVGSGNSVSSVAGADNAQSMVLVTHHRPPVEVHRCLNRDDEPRQVIGEDEKAQEHLVERVDGESSQDTRGAGPGLSLVRFGLTMGETAFQMRINGMFGCSSFVVWALSCGVFTCPTVMCCGGLIAILISMGNAWDSSGLVGVYIILIIIIAIEILIICVVTCPMMACVCGMGRVYSKAVASAAKNKVHLWSTSVSLPREFADSVVSAVCMSPDGRWAYLATYQLLPAGDPSLVDCLPGTKARPSAPGVYFSDGVPGASGRLARPSMMRRLSEIAGTRAGPEHRTMSGQGGVMWRACILRVSVNGWKMKTVGTVEISTPLIETHPAGTLDAPPAPIKAMQVDRDTDILYALSEDAVVCLSPKGEVTAVPVTGMPTNSVVTAARFDLDRSAAWLCTKAHSSAAVSATTPGSGFAQYHYVRIGLGMARGGGTPAGTPAGTPKDGPALDLNVAIRPCPSPCNSIDIVARNDGEVRVIIAGLDGASLMEVDGKDPTAAAISIRTIPAAPDMASKKDIEMVDMQGNRGSQFLCALAAVAESSGISLLVSGYKEGSQAGYISESFLPPQAPSKVGIVPHGKAMHIKSIPMGGFRRRGGRRMQRQQAGDPS